MMFVCSFRWRASIFNSIDFNFLYPVPCLFRKWLIMRIILNHLAYISSFLQTRIIIKCLPVLNYFSYLSKTYALVWTLPKSTVTHLRIQETSVHLWSVDFDPFCLFLLFHGLLAGGTILLWLTATKLAIVNWVLNFSGPVYEKHNNAY